MNKISIFVDAHVFDGEHQGTKTFIREIYKRLSLIPSIHLILAARDKKNLEQVFGKRENIEFVEYKSESSYVRLAIEIPQILFKMRPDYAHFQYVVPPFKFCKYIVTTHDLLFLDFPKEFPLSYRLSKNILFKNSIRRSDIITTVSNYSKETILKHYNLTKIKVEIIPNGVTDRFFETYEKRQSQEYIEKQFSIKNYILYVSRIEPRKQQAVLLAAYLELELFKKGIQLVLIGHVSIPDPELDSQLNSISPEVKQHIHFLNNIGDNDLQEFYKGALLFVYPSLAEGFGIPPLESAALGVPTLCSNATAMQDFHFFGCYHVTPRIEEIKSLMYKIFFEGQTQSSQEIEQIRQEIKMRYSWDNSVNKLYNIILNHNESGKY